FPGARLILSTWKTESDAVLNAFRKLGIEVVQSDPPEKPGQQNINFQLVSSRAGVERAAEMGAQYVLKTRTDQRLYSANLQPMRMSLWDVFHPKPNGIQKHR